MPRHWVVIYNPIKVSNGFVDRVISSLDEIRPAGRPSGLGY